MSNAVTWYMGNELVLDIVAPLDVIDRVTPVVVDSATVAGYLFQKRVQMKLTADAAASQADIVVDKVTDVAAADRIVLMGDDGGLDQYEVLSINPTTKTITMTGNLSAAVTVGKEAHLVEGVQAVLAGVSYGTPATTHSNWGYTLAFDNAYAPTVIDGMLLTAYATVEKSGTGVLYSTSWDVIVAPARGSV